jgi:hypothetical protein
MSASAADFGSAHYPDLDPIKYRRLIAMLEDAIAMAERGNSETLAFLRRLDGWTCNG